MTAPKSPVPVANGAPPSREVFAELYADLHRMAARELRRNPAATLSATTLLHETFLNMPRRDPAEFGGEAGMLAYMARAMRTLVIDYVRTRNTLKRGRDFEITSLPTELPYAEAQDPSMERLGDAMNMLANIDSRLAECVDLKFFCGFSCSDIANMWQVSERTVQRDWERARLLLHRLMNNEEESTSAAV